jgi:hypothetical protein
MIIIKESFILAVYEVLPVTRYRPKVTKLVTVAECDVTILAVRCIRAGCLRAAFAGSTARR